MGRNTIVSTLSLHLLAATVAIAGGGGGNGQPNNGQANPPPDVVIDEPVGPDVAPTTLTRSERDAQRGVALPTHVGDAVPEAPPVLPETDPRPEATTVAPTKVSGQLRLRGEQLLLVPPRNVDAPTYEIKLVGDDTPALRRLIHERIGLAEPVEVQGTIAGVNTLNATRFSSGPRMIAHTSIAGGAHKGKIASSPSLRIGQLLIDRQTPGDHAATLNANVDKEASAEGWILTLNGNDRAIIPTKVEVGAPAEPPTGTDVDVAALGNKDAETLAGGPQRRDGMGNALETGVDLTEPAPTVVTEEPAPTVVTEEPAPTVVTEEPAPTVVTEEPAPTVVTEEPAPTVVTEEPAPTVVTEEPAPQVVTEEPPPQAVPSKVKFESGYLYDLVQRLDGELPAAEKAKGHRITVPMVMLANNLTPGSVVAPRAGRELTIPAAAKPETLVVKNRAGKPQHWVQDGERLITIARRYGTDVQKLLELNPTVAQRVAAKGPLVGLRSNDLLLLPEGAKLEGTREVTPAGAR